MTKSLSPIAFAAALFVSAVLFIAAAAPLLSVAAQIVA